MIKRILLTLAVGAILTPSKTFSEDKVNDHPGSLTGSKSPVDVEQRELRPRDRLSFRIDEDPVRGTEFITVEITDTHKALFKVSRGADRAIILDVKGKRLSQIRAELKEKLEQDFYVTATLSLELAETGNRNTSGSSGKVMFMGAVKGFAPIPEDGKLMLSEAVMRMNPSDWADLSKVRVLRRDKDSGKSETLKMDLKKMFKDNSFDNDIELQDGDKIEIPERFIKFGN